MESIVDSNNNASCGKYSLRPRTGTRNSSEDLEDGEAKPVVRSKRKISQRSHPLSKYRRKSANARERSRMREINEAFETLRKVVSGHRNVLPGEKTTKISTLRLAMQYITTLKEVLQDHSDGEVDVADSSTARLSEDILETSRPIVSPVPSDCLRSTCSVVSLESLPSSFNSIYSRLADSEHTLGNFVDLSCQVSAAFLSSRHPRDFLTDSAASSSCALTPSMTKLDCESESSHSLVGTEPSVNVIQCDTLTNDSQQSCENFKIPYVTVESDSNIQTLLPSSCERLPDYQNSLFNTTDIESSSRLLSNEVEGLTFQTLEEMFI